MNEDDTNTDDKGGDDIDAELRKMQEAEEAGAEGDDEEEAGAAGAGGQPRAEAENQAGAEGRQPESVPLAVALEWKKEAKGLRDEVTGLKGQLEQFLKTVKGSTEKQEDEPSFEDSPVEYLAHQQRKQIELINNLQKALEDQRTTNHVQAVQSEIKAIEQGFAAKNPDYWQATAFLAQSRIKELVDVFGYSEEEAQKRFSEDTARFINSATARGKSFAEEAYTMARKMGFKGGAPAAANGNGAARRVAGESLKDTARKLQAARSLASAGGKAPKDELTPEDALEMSDEDFDKAFTGEEGTKRMRALFGD